MPGYLVIEGVSSNKQEGEKTGEKKKGKIELSEISYCPIKGRVAVLKPFIDKITITYKIADQELTATLVESLLQEADKEQGHFKKAAQFKTGAVSYGASVNLIVPPGDAQVLIQAGPKKKGPASRIQSQQARKAGDRIFKNADRFSRVWSCCFGRPEFRRHHREGDGDASRYCSRCRRHPG